MGHNLIAGGGSTCPFVPPPPQSTNDLVANYNYKRTCSMVIDDRENSTQLANFAITSNERLRKTVNLAADS